MNDEQRQELRDFAVDAATQAGDLTLEHFGSNAGYELKADNTPVTIADRSAEELLRARIEQAYPAHGIVGEEFGEKPGRQPARWIIDPIDGTFSFICGVPLYCVLVGLEWQGRMLVGVIHAPALEETVYAGRGLGCTWRTRSGGERPAKVSAIDELSRARLLTGSAKTMYKHGRGPVFERLRDACYTDRAWCDAYAYLLIATGRAEIMLDPILNLWDTAALLPVVTEAGGTLTDWQGEATHTAPEAIATNGVLFDAVMAAVRQKRG